MKNNIQSAIILVVILFLLNACSSAKRINKDLVEESKTNTFFKGLVVYNPKTDKVLMNYNGNKYFTPASNTKLFTFYAAYRSLPDSVTGLKYALHQDSLIIKGTADPSFLYGFEESKTLDFLKSKSENIYLIDESIAENSLGFGWAWDDYGYYYMPEKSLFPIYGNLIKLTKKGNVIAVKPSFFQNNIKVDDSIFIRRDVFENNFYVQNSTEVTDREIPFKTSNQLVADLLSKELQKKVTLIQPDKQNDFKEFKSVAYDSLYKQMLTISDNFIAEQLMIQVGYAKNEKYSVEKGIEYALDNYMQDIPQKPRWVDGSGLSRYNLFTPESMVYVLKKMYREIPHDKLFAFLPAGGVSGTLKNTFKNEKPFIFAKSGTLSNNYNLSGYLITKKGTILIFSYMNNHYPDGSSDRKKEMEKVFLTLYDSY